jgi:hypothetical protein
LFITLLSLDETGASDSIDVMGSEALDILISRHLNRLNGDVGTFGGGFIN